MKNARKNRALAGLLAIVLTLLSLPVLSLPAAAQEECAPEDYDALIVKDGLKLWLDTRGEYAPDPKTGVWKSRVGEGEAVLEGALWEIASDGGLTYAFRSVDDWRSYRGKNGLKLEGDNRPLGDFTVEYNAVFHGIVDGDGNVVWHEESMGQYGFYNGALSAWSFGALHFMQFMPSHAAGGNSLRVRAMYSANTSYDQTGYVNTMGDYAMTRGLSFRDFYSVCFSHTKALAGDAYDRALYRWYRNGMEFYSFDNQKATVEAARCYIPNEEGKFRLFYDLPLTVYSVRVYDRALLEWERNQNYFSDACRYNGVSVKGVAELPLKQRIALYSLVADWQPEWTEAEKQTVRDMVALYRGEDLSAAAAIVSFRGVEMRLDAPGLRAVFGVNSPLLERVESLYEISFGAILAEADAEVSLTVKDGEALAEGGILVPAYRTGEEETLVSSEEGSAAFRVGASVGGESAAHFEHEFSYYYYVTVTDGEGESVAFLMKAEGARLGDTFSFAEGADLLVNDYKGSPYFGYLYNENETLTGILAAAGREARSYRPGQVLSDMREIYVSPDAKGGDGSEAAPFGTLEEAFERAKELFRGKENVSVTVHLSDGVYRTAGVGLNKGDMKEGDWFTLIGSEDAVITGSVAVSPEFEAVEGEDYLVASLPKTEGEYPTFRYLTVNGTLADLAYRGYRRYAVAKEEGGLQWQTGKVVNDSTKGDYRIYCDPAAFSGMTAAEIRGAELHVEVEWEYKIMHVDRVDFKDKDAEGRVAVYITEEDFKACVKTNLGYQNRYFWVENRLNFLDSPGEYYYDGEGGLLYYMPREGEDVTASVFEIPRTENVLSFVNTENVTLSGFTVTGCDNLLVETEGHYGGSQAGGKTGGVHRQAAVFAENAANLTVLGITVENVAADGLQARGALDGVVVADSTFRHIGASAIRLGANNGTWSEANHLVNGFVSGNLIEDAAWYLRQNCGLYVAIAKDTKILHNTIRDCSYTAISAGWSWSSATWMPHENYNLYNVEIAYNLMENYMTDMSDGGGIYTLGGNLANRLPQYVNFMHHNVAVENANTGAGKGRFMSLYHDGSSSHWYSTKNVVVTAIHLENSGLGSFYLQINPAPDHQVLVEGNYFLNADWTKPVKIAGREITGVNSPEDYMEKVIFWSHTRPENNSIQRNNVCYAPDETPSEECLAILEAAGCGRD